MRLSLLVTWPNFLQFYLQVETRPWLDYRRLDSELLGPDNPSKLLCNYDDSNSSPEVEKSSRDDSESSPNDRNSSPEVEKSSRDDSESGQNDGDSSPEVEKSSRDDSVSESSGDEERPEQHEFPDPFVDLMENQDMEDVEVQYNIFLYT